MNTNKISLIGLGKLGLPLLSTFGKHGQKIIGVFNAAADAFQRD